MASRSTCNLCRRSEWRALCQPSSSHPRPHPSLLGRRQSLVLLRDPGGKQANRHHRHSMTPSYFPPDPSLPFLTLPPDPSLPFLTLPPLTSLPLPPEARAPRSA